MEEWKELGEEVNRLLKLKTPTLGVKLFRRVEDIPSDVERITWPCSVCQVLGIARYHDKAVAVTKDEATSCAIGGAALGFYEVPEDLKSGRRNVGLWARDQEACRKLAEVAMIKAGTFSAMMASPLGKMSEEPDVVLVYGNPAQILTLIYGHVWVTGEKVRMETTGHGGSCSEAIAAPYLTGEIRVAITDIGERKFALAYDYEMVMGIPYSRLPTLVEGLREAYNAIYKYPAPLHGLVPWEEGALRRAGLKPPS